MYVLVSHSDDFGLEYCGKFDSHKEAYEYIANSVMECCDNNFDIMSMYPFDVEDYGVDCLRYSDNGTEVFAGMDWCNCYTRHYSDKYLIIKI